MGFMKPTGGKAPVWVKGTRKVETVLGSLRGMSNPGYTPKKGTKLKSN